MKENNRISRFLIFTLLIAIILASYGSYKYFFTFSSNLKLSTDQEVWAWFGDYLGGILSPIFAFAGLLALLYSIHLQHNELRNSTEQLKISAGALVKQNNLIQKQNFEVTFFQMLKLLNDIIQGLTITQIKNAVDIKIKGRESINWVYGLLEEHHYKSRSVKTNDVELTRLEKLDADYHAIMTLKGSSYITHYLRAIFNILKFIRSSNLSDTEKETYTEILWGQLSREELSLIFYYSISEFGEDEMLPLCSQYGFLEYIAKTSILYVPADINLAKQILEKGNPLRNANSKNSLAIKK